MLNQNGKQGVHHLSRYNSKRRKSSRRSQRNTAMLTENGMTLCNSGHLLISLSFRLIFASSNNVDVIWASVASKLILAPGFD